MALTQKQIIGIRKANVLKFYKAKWEEKYKENYVHPEDFMGVDRNINLALAAYEVVVINASIEEYLRATSEYYKFHPIRIWAKNITYWVMLAKENQKKPQQVKQSADDTAILTKYGISHKGDFYITESGGIFTKLEQAIAAATSRKK